ncbi:MAG: hypothetical protein WAR24_03480 [Candidatus Acidiferrales bacterium]
MGIPAANSFQKGLLRWCVQQEWNWLMRLPLSQNVDPDFWQVRFWELMREIERVDGTWSFRWVQFVPYGFTGFPEKFHILVGGLGSGEWRYCGRLWAAMNCAPETRGVNEWRSGQERSLAQVLNKLFGMDLFLINVQLGPNSLRRERRLEVDKGGIPFDQKIRRTILIAEGESRQVPMENVHTIVDRDGSMYQPLPGTVDGLKRPGGVFFAQDKPPRWRGRGR